MVHERGAQTEEGKIASLDTNSNPNLYISVVNTNTSITGFNWPPSLQREIRTLHLEVHHRLPEPQYSHVLTAQCALHRPLDLG